MVTEFQSFVVGVTPHQGKRESRLQGEVEQVTRCNRNREVRVMRTAKTILNIIRRVTGKLRDTETVMRSLEGGGWKSASNGNSLATYPTLRTVLKQR
jgi:hypothetical protein